jgi:hypothetical protein
VDGHQEPTDASTVLKECRARLIQRIQEIDAQLEMRGMVDAQGRLRRDYLREWRALVRTLHALDGPMAPVATGDSATLDEYLHRVFGRRP